MDVASTKKGERIVLYLHSQVEWQAARPRERGNPFPCIECRNWFHATAQSRKDIYLRYVVAPSREIGLTPRRKAESLRDYFILNGDEGIR